MWISVPNVDFCPLGRMQSDDLWLKLDESTITDPLIVFTNDIPDSESYYRKNMGAILRKEGCNIAGHLRVNRVAGRWMVWMVEMDDG